MLVILSKADDVVSQHHVETPFKEVHLPFEELHMLTVKYRYSSSTYSNGHRAGKNCSSFGNLLIFDVDNDREYKLSLNQAVILFEGIKSLIVTTKSHQKNKNGIIEDRYRIVLPLDDKIGVDKDDYSELYMHVASLLGIESVIDRACKDVARMYQPCMSQKVYYSNDVNPLSMEQLLLSFNARKEQDELERYIAVHDEVIPSHNGTKADYLRSINFSNRLLTLINYDSRFIKGNRNTFLFSTGSYLKESGLSTHEIRSALSWINSLQNSLLYFPIYIQLKVLL